MIFSIDHADRLHRVALINGISGKSWTYGELVVQVSRHREALSGRRKSLFFHFCQNNLESVAQYLGAVEADHAVALLSCALDGGLRAQLIEHYKPEFMSGAPPEGAPYSELPISGVWSRNEGPAGEIHPSLSLLLSTSGSTGSPKFVRLSRENVIANARSIKQALGIEPEDCPVAHLPMNYSYGLSVINSHLLAGARIVLTDSGILTSPFWESIRAYGVNSFSGVPYTYQMLKRLGLEKVNAPSVKIMTQAGGKLDDQTIAHFHERMVARHGSFWVMYGQTEATARITILPANDLPEKLGSAGRAIPSGKLRIQTDDGALTESASIEGELVYDGPNVMLGYATQREDLSSGDIQGGRLFTGDKAILDNGGCVRILGRAKRDAKIFGLRVNLDELEALIEHQGPAAAIPSEKGITIFCEFRDAHDYSRLAQELSTKLRIHRSGFVFQYIDKLPTKESGKINYEQLKDML